MAETERNPELLLTFISSCCRMEKPLIPSQSVTPIAVLSKQYHPTQFSPKPTSLFPRIANPVITDAHLRNLCNNGRLGEAISVIDLIARSGSKVRSDTYKDLLQACIDSGNIHLGRQLHARIGAVKGVDPFMAARLVGMYAKCGYLEDARKVFAEMRDRNLHTWSAMIGACARDHRWKEVVELFYSMMGDGILPDWFLLPKILKACGNCRDLEAGRLIHSLVIRKGLSSIRVKNSILAVYAKCGKLNLAREIFDTMDERDGVSWNAIISGYCQKGDIEEARRLFKAMRDEGTGPELITWNILISTYSQLGYCDFALEFMNEMKSSGISPDVFTWTSMVSGFAQNNKMSQAFDLFKEMLEAGVKPNGVTLVSAISACAKLKALNKGLELHCIAFKLGFVQDTLVGNSLIDMFSKCGELEAARRCFDMVSEKDIITWNSMIGGYCQAGYCGKAYELFIKVQESNVSCNVITWNAMISGYIQNGDKDEAIELFQRMESNGKIKRDTASWNSLIAGYVQNGEINKSLRIFRQMQYFGVSLNSITVLSVLPACANLLAAKKVREIHACVLRRDLESDPSVANSLIGTYAKSGNMVYSRTIFDQMSAKDTFSWNSLIAGYTLHGCSDAAIHMFDQMEKLGVKKNWGTLLSIISAYGLAGMVEEGKQAFTCMTEEYHISPALDHYLAMVNLYGRSGRLVEAMEFIKSMPFAPNSSIWAALLTACKIHRNVGLAMHAAQHLHELEPWNFAIHQLILQFYALSGGRPQDALVARKLEKKNGMKRPVGRSWVEVRNTVYSFVTGDSSQPYSHILHSWVERISGKVDMSDIRYGFEEEREEIDGVRSEKLAIAFAFASSPGVPRSIRIVKNLRMCEDCHRTAKYVSLTYGCEIYLSDPGCFHHFKNGSCSCRDYW